MKTAVVCLSEKGGRVAQTIKTGPTSGRLDIYLPEKIKKADKNGCYYYSYPLSKLVKTIFTGYDALVFIMALGIVVREISPLLSNKEKDPAVITLDETAKYCIATLGGHEAGANKLTKQIASITGAQAVVTTASEQSQLTLGIGLRKNKSVRAIKDTILSALHKKNLSPENVKQILTIDIKKDDKALRKACEDLSLPLRFVTKEEINKLETDFQISEFVIGKIGAKAVCEPAALIGSENKQLVMQKTVFDGITIAIAR